jgi:hypothetical protein
VVAFPQRAKAKNPAAVALGKLGGAKGGRIRAEKLSDEEKKAIARLGGLARQAKARIQREAEATASRQEGSRRPTD